MLADDSQFPQIADVTAPFIYARIMGTSEDEALGYSPATLEAWVNRARLWESGDQPQDLQLVEASKPDGVARNVYLYVISGFKLRNPAAARALIERL